MSPIVIAVTWLSLGVALGFIAASAALHRLAADTTRDREQLATQKAVVAARMAALTDLERDLQGLEDQVRIATTMRIANMLLESAAHSRDVSGPPRCPQFPDESQCATEAERDEPWPPSLPSQS